ncbi:MAG TPA: YdcF family protein [Bacteroidia bacterium]|jgi:uncharacterized SAM-binding protein YcdF (DUF218 family)
MFFLFSKILAFLITPIIWIIGLFIYSFITKVEKRKKRSRLAVLIMLLFFTNTALYNTAMHLWEIPAVMDKDITQTYDAGIVLGGVLNYDPSMDKIQFNKSNDRLMHAVDLYEKGKIKKIVFVGGSGSLLHPEFKEAEHIKKFLLGLGIPDSSIVIETDSKNTHENAMNLKPILDKKIPHGKFLLITSAFHMRRSLGCFQKAGIGVTPYSTDRMSGGWRWDLDFLIVPHSDILEGWDILLHEIMGEVMYKLAGYA